ncbi:uncharacterized protein LOC131693124 [Topomyia yanbarensis]|uniref:uncharacterized protein LOC131693124 n=1 Tax=Topomyia yanbarensis TaxID=2498891 RepID=UPI00273B587B|nr:uncharacterized protein LOC131693124 [Topomyia yanbarensis]XP_058836678.1 uncharacterized protein LOC131693124 [Topomyia yanbarensis]XP_058836679.1 uncharacterized protein LOC131693124 [Topomyia yanbarensis]
MENRFPNAYHLTNDEVDYELIIRGRLEETRWDLEGKCQFLGKLFRTDARRNREYRSQYTIYQEYNHILAKVDFFGRKLDREPDDRLISRLKHYLLRVTRCKTPDPFSEIMRRDLVDKIHTLLIRSNEKGGPVKQSRKLASEKHERPVHNAYAVDFDRPESQDWEAMESQSELLYPQSLPRSVEECPQQINRSDELLARIAELEHEIAKVNRANQRKLNAPIENDTDNTRFDQPFYSGHGMIESNYLHSDWHESCVRDGLTNSWVEDHSRDCRADEIARGRQQLYRFPEEFGHNDRENRQGRSGRVERKFQRSEGDCLHDSLQSGYSSSSEEVGDDQDCPSRSFYERSRETNHEVGYSGSSYFDTDELDRTRNQYEDDLESYKPLNTNITEPIRLDTVPNEAGSTDEHSDTDELWETGLTGGSTKFGGREIYSCIDKILNNVAIPVIDPMLSDSLVIEETWDGLMLGISPVPSEGSNRIAHLILTSGSKVEENGFCGIVGKNSGKSGKESGEGLSVPSKCETAESQNTLLENAKIDRDVKKQGRIPSLVKSESCPIRRRRVLVSDGRAYCRLRDSLVTEDVQSRNQKRFYKKSGYVNYNTYSVKEGIPANNLEQSGKGKLYVSVLAFKYVLADAKWVKGAHCYDIEDLSGKRPTILNFKYRRKLYPPNSSLSPT